MKVHRRGGVKITTCVALSPDTLRSIDDLLEHGNFVGTALRRRSRSAVVEELLQYAIGKFPEWVRQRLNARKVEV